VSVTSDSSAEPDTPEPAASAGRNVPAAIASGVALAAVFVATLWVSPWLFLAFVAALILVAMLELDVVLRGSGLRPATPVAVVAGLRPARGAPPRRPPAPAPGRGGRPAGPAIAIVGAERATDGAIPPEAIRRAASLEDVFVLLTGEEAE
jgi:hypothetical protein